MELPEVTFDRAPRIVFWETTKACDFSCRHCRANAIPDRDPDELDTGEAKSMIESLTQGGNTTLVFTGGDPLKRPDLLELLEFSDEAGLRTVIAPSGTKMIDDPTVEEFLDAGVEGISLSLDGSTADLHDEFRGEEGVYEWTTAAADSCREKGLPLQINTTVSRETVEDLASISSLVEEMGVARWSLFFLVPTGRAKLLEPLPPEKVEETLEWLVEVSREGSLSVKTTEAHHFRRLLIQRELEEGNSLEEVLGLGGPGRPKVRGLGINDGNGVMFVSHVGKVYPSGFLPVAAGDVREEEPLELYRNSELFDELRDRSLRKGKCGECEFRGICGGSRAQAYAVEGDYLAADPTCTYQPGGVE